MTKMPRSCSCRCASGVVGPLAPSATILALIDRRVLLGDLILERRRDEHVDVEREQLIVLDRLAAGEAVDRLVLLRVLDHLRDVEARRGCRRRPSSR